MRIFSLEFAVVRWTSRAVVGIRDAFVGIRGRGWTSRRVRWNSRAVVGLRDAFVGIRGRWLDFTTRSLEFAGVVGLRDAFVGIRGDGWTSRRVRWNSWAIGWNAWRDALIGHRVKLPGNKKTSSHNS